MRIREGVGDLGSVLRGSDGLIRNILKKYWRNLNLTLAMMKMTIVISCVKLDSFPLMYSFLVQVNETPGTDIHW